MSGNTRQLASHLQIDHCIDPDILTVTTHDGPWFDMREYKACTFVINVGTLGANATFDAEVREANTSAGGTPLTVSDTNAGVSDVDITQITQAGTDGSDQTVLLTVTQEDLSESSGYAWVSLRITVGTQSCDGGATAIRFRKTGELP